MVWSPARGRWRRVAAGRRTIARVSLEEIFEAEALDQLVMPGGIVASGDARLEREVVFDSQARNQIELLEYQAEAIPAQFGAAGIARARRPAHSPA
jgi:hypothetical protein